MDANNSFLNKTILLVNTGSQKKRFIVQKIKKLGVKIVALNYEKNWAQPYIDHWIITDNRNHSKALEDLGLFLLSNPEIKIDGVITFWEDDVLLTSKIADKFNFIGIPYQVASKARNKYLFREFCHTRGLPTPKYKLVQERKNDLEYICNNFSFPLVIKPTYGASSAYVVKVANRDELYTTFDYIKNNLSVNTESALSDGLDILVEEYIDGDEVDIDILLQNGKIKFYSITDNYKTREPFFVETGQAIPSSLPRKEQGELIAMAEEVLERMGVQNGCIHFEAKSTKQGPIPIEANLRMGGDEVYSFVKGAWNVDLIENAVKIACGIYIKVKKPEIPRKYITGKYFLADNSGILVEMDIDEDIHKKKCLEEINFYKEIGDPVLIPPEGYEFLGWLTVSGDNPLDAEDNLNDAIKMIKYSVVKFDPDSSLGKTSRRSPFSSAVLQKNLLLGAAKLEKVKRTSMSNQKKLRIGIIGNAYENTKDSLEERLTLFGQDICKVLSGRGYKVIFFDFNNFPKVISDLRENSIDLIFNACDRINNSNILKPHAVSLLESLQIPYAGSNPLTLALCSDKIKVKKMLSYHNIPTPKWDYAYDLDDTISDDLKYPLIVKPAYLDHSIGISNKSVVANPKEMQEQLNNVIVNLKQPALVEEYINGDEYDVAILGNEDNDLQVLPLARSIFKNMPNDYWHIYTYEAKWFNRPEYDSIIVQHPSRNISKKLQTLITEIALDVYNILGCRDYGRVEIRVDEDNNPYVLELNPNPVLERNSCVANSAKLIGLDYGDLLEEIISIAVMRYKNRPSCYNL